jgi:AcrR family transcriptional regulator
VTTDTISPTRVRLLEAAADLFYRHGPQVGVDAVCRTAGVSKRSAYQMFDSKEDLLAAGLEYRTSAYLGYLFPREGDDQSPAEQILHVFRRLEKLSGSAAYRGCPFVAAAVEVRDPLDPTSVAARRAKDLLTAFFQTRAAEAGAADPEVLARRLTFVFDGGSAFVAVQARDLDGAAVDMAREVLSQAGLL